MLLVTPRGSDQKTQVDPARSYKNMLKKRGVFWRNSAFIQHISAFPFACTATYFISNRWDATPSVVVCCLWGCCLFLSTNVSCWVQNVLIVKRRSFSPTRDPDWIVLISRCKRHLVEREQQLSWPVAGTVGVWGVAFAGTWSSWTLPLWSLFSLRRSNSVMASWSSLAPFSPLCFLSGSITDACLSNGAFEDHPPTAFFGFGAWCKSLIFFPPSLFFESLLLHL